MQGQGRRHRHRHGAERALRRGCRPRRGPCPIMENPRHKPELKPETKARHTHTSMGMSCSVVPGMADSTGRYLARWGASGSYCREDMELMSLQGSMHEWVTHGWVWWAGRVCTGGCLGYNLERYGGPRARPRTEATQYRHDRGLWAYAAQPRWPCHPVRCAERAGHAGPARSPDQRWDEGRLAHVGCAHHVHIPPPPLLTDGCHRLGHARAGACRDLPLFK